MDVPVYNMQGQEVGAYSIDEASLGGRINPHLIKQAFVMYHANLRQGSARTRNRTMLEHTGKKMYKQKGTGRARHGDKKVAQFKGGGHVHNKTRTRDDYHQAMPKKMRRKANRNALLAKLLDSEVRIIDSISMSEPKTRDFRAMLEALGIDRTVLVALSPDGGKSDAPRRSARNIDDVSLCRADQLTAYEMLNHRYMVIERDELDAWLNGPSSQTDKQARVNPMGRAASGEGA